MQTQSEKIDAIALAMNGVQAALKPATKSSDNPFFKSKYADLGEVWAACSEALALEGIAVIQGCVPIDGQSYMETKLIHTSGQWLTSYWLLQPVKPDPQALGSAITYMRRYSLAAMVGVLSEDDDGNAATRTAEAPVASTRAKNSRDMDWRGPLGKTALQNELKAFATALGAEMHIPDELDNLVDEYRAVLDQCRVDIPSWWEGGPSVPAEFVPLQRRIEAKRKFIEGLSRPNTVMGAG